MAVNLSSETRAFIASHRVARLATVDASGTPHLVPICYVYDGRHIYSALDLKPKRVAARELRRVRNIRSDPKVAVLIDDYSEDWADLAYVLVQGIAVVLESGDERAAAETMLRDKYDQYRDALEDGCLVVRVTPENVVAWGRVERAGQPLESHMSNQRKRPVLKSLCNMAHSTRLALVATIGVLTLLVAAGCVTDKEVMAEAVRKYEEGRSYQEEGNLSRAGEAYHDAIGLNPRLAEAYVGRGYVYYATGNTRLAMDDFNQAIDLDPRLADAYNYRGLVYLAADDSQAALLNFTRAVEIDPELAEAYYNRAKISESDGDYRSAIEDLSEVVRLEPDAPVFYMERARLYVLTQDTDGAIADLEQVLTITDDEKWVVPAKQRLSTLRQDG